MEMKDGSAVKDHLKDMKELTDRLAAIGAPISEEDQVVTLLGSLPRSYNGLVTALEARGDNISLDFVQQAIVNEEQKRCSTFKDGSNALMVGSSRDGDQQGYHVKNGDHRGYQQQKPRSGDYRGYHKKTYGGNHGGRPQGGKKSRVLQLRTDRSLQERLQGKAAQGQCCRQ